MNEKQAIAKIKQMNANGLTISPEQYYKTLHMLMHGKKTPVLCTIYPIIKKETTK